MRKFKIGDYVEIHSGDWSGVRGVVIGFNGGWTKVSPDVGSIYTGMNAGRLVSEDYRARGAGFHDTDLTLIEQIPSIDAHYTKYAIQPMEFSLANGLDPAQHTVIKYVVRYRDKHGVRDLRAAIRVLELMIEREEKANG